MKSNIVESIFLRKIAFVFTLLMISSSLMFAQSAKKISPKKKFVYEKLEDGTRVLNAYIFYKGSNGWLPLPDVDVKFTAKDDSTKIDLATIPTNKDGYAILHIENGFKMPKNEEGLTVYEFVSIANDSVKSTKASLKMIDANLSLNFDKTEEANNLTVSVKDINGEAVSKMKVQVFVKRMHSLLPIGDDKTDSNGQITVEVPKDIPGDYDGIINVIAKVEKNRKYGNLQVSSDIDWGVPNTYNVSAEEKNLWSEASPLWLELAVYGTFALIFLFFGVAIKNVYLMSKDQ